MDNHSGSGPLFGEPRPLIYLSFLISVLIKSLIKTLQFAAEFLELDLSSIV
jgi:hypothetical protein